MSSLSLTWLRRFPIFRNFLGSMTVSMLGTSIFDIAMPLYVWDRTHSPVSLALVSVSLTLPYFVMAPFTGYAVDNFNSRRLMIFSDLGQIASLLLLLLTDYFSTTHVWAIMLGCFVAKSLTIMFETVATFHLIPSLVPEEHLDEANAWFLTSLRFIQVVGPLAGGAFMSFVGFRSCIWLNVLSFGATLFFVFKMKNLGDLIGERQLKKTRPHSARAVYHSFVWSVKYIWSSPLFRPFIFAMFFWNLSSLVPNTTSFTYYFRGLKGFSSAEYGLIASLFGCLGIVGFLIGTNFYRKYEFSKAFVGACLWQAFLGTACLAFFVHPVLLALVFGFSRVGSSVLAIGSFNIRQTEVPVERLGAVNSSIRMHFMAAAPVSALLQGYLIKHFGVGASFGMGALCLWATYHYARKVGSAYDLTTQEETRPAAA